jgi:hypothetical protein
MWDLCWTKLHCNGFPLSSLLSPANFCAAKCSIFIYHSGAGTVGRLVAEVPSGLSLTPPQGGKTELPIHCVSAGTLVLNKARKVWCLVRKANPSSWQIGGPISRHINGLWMNKFWSWVPKGPETKNDCAGEALQKFSILCNNQNCTALHSGPSLAVSRSAQTPESWEA